MVPSKHTVTWEFIRDKKWVHFKNQTVNNSKEMVRGRWVC